MFKVLRNSFSTVKSLKLDTGSVGPFSQKTISSVLFLLLIIILSISSLFIFGENESFTENASPLSQLTQQPNKDISTIISTLSDPKKYSNKFKGKTADISKITKK